MSERSIKPALVLSAAFAIAVEAAPAAAQEAGAGASVEDIVVTARRVEERLQDVPISISVLSQEQLANRNIYNGSDLGSYTPSLATNSRFGPEKTSFAIRGFTQELVTSPSVGIYFADVVAPRASGQTTSGNGAGVGSFFDLQNVQILKGPQGTLFGRNTTGGAILLVPQKPTDRLEGYVEGSLGNYDLRRVEAVLNLPMSDTFRVRLGIDRNKRDGYLRNHSGIGPKRMADTDYIAARLSLVADLTPELENYLIASYSRSDTNGSVGRMLICDRDRAATPAGFLAALGCAQIDRQAARGDGFWDVENGIPDPYMRFRNLSVINTTTWAASDTLTIKNIISYQEFSEASTFSIDSDNFALAPGVPLPIITLNAGPSGYNSDQSTFIEELQVQGTTADGRLEWQAGAYLEISKPLGFSSGNVQILLPCSDVRGLQCVDVLSPGPGITVGSILNTNIKDSFNNKGFYAQATYKLTDQLSVTGGIRYTIDKMTDVAENVSIKFPAPNTPRYTCYDVIRINSNPATLAPLVVDSPAQCRVKLSIKSERPTWLLGLDYKPADDVLLYAKWARGYRQGGINPNNLGLDIWGPEKVDTYEVGAKTSFRGAVSGYFNLAAFYNDFTDQQIAANLLPAPAFTGTLGGAQAIVNAGKSRIWGVEVDASVSPFEGFRLDVGYAYLNTKLKEINLPPTPPVYLPIFSTADVGGPLALAPKNRVTVEASYTLPLSDDVGRITLSANFTHTDANNAVSPVATPLYRLEATDLLNLNASWKSILGAPVDLAFFMTNATNEKYLIFPNVSWGSFGFDGGATNVPRMWGFRLKYHFGD